MLLLYASAGGISLLKYTAARIILTFYISDVSIIALAGMVEQVDTRDLKSLALTRRTGSIPVTGTI